MTFSYETWHCIDFNCILLRNAWWMLKDLDIYHYYSDLFICCTYTVFYSNIKNGGNTYDDYQKRTLTSQEASGTSEALDYFGRCHPNHTSSQSQSEKKPQKISSSDVYHYQSTFHILH